MREQTIVRRFGESFPGESGGRFLVSAPGRMEILGNHTDHQHGYVLTAAIDLDMLGLAAKSADNTVTVYSGGFPVDRVDLSSLDPRPEENHTSAALIRGVAAGLVRGGHAIGGFNAYADNAVLKGSGLSSSAAFEVWVATAFNAIYNEGKIDAIEIAKIGQYAENVYFGKPCGLQDQLASSVGGLLFIDFEDTIDPECERLAVDLSGYAIIVIDSGADHADLTPEYAAITEDLTGISSEFSAAFLRHVDRGSFRDSVPELRRKFGDRAVLRAFHIYHENERVLRAKSCLEAGDIEGFFREVRKSGESSFMYLQNVSVSGRHDQQDLAVVLAAASDFLGDSGAFRIQGGGFAGTVEAFVPIAMKDSFIEWMEMAIRPGCCHVLAIREIGAYAERYSEE